MAKSKKKRRPQGARQGTSTANAAQPDGGKQHQPAARGGANPARRERKELARLTREAERKRAARTAALRRAAIFSGVGLAAFAALLWFQRAAAPTELSQAAVAAASAAGCSELTSPAGSPSGEHVDQPTITYPERPPTSGQHYQGSVLPTSPEIYTEPVDEPASVHFLEHGGVIMYYQPEGEEALPQRVTDALGAVATDQRNTLLAPFPDLPAGESLALTAWNKKVTCPAGVTPQQATTIATSFAEALACTSNAPEEGVSDDC